LDLESRSSIIPAISQQQTQNDMLMLRQSCARLEQMKMSDERRGRLRHADMVDGDVMGSKGMGGKKVVTMM
jgi:hypothetical protein